ncbi:MAG: DNA-3-methyladenine glycosylase [candidate division Zixibacteria bacterium]|nr:DNA-3-methyladenine glycosylase [candidate division Zixibacteria bacterium]
MARPTRLTRAFYDRPTLEVCRDCLGKYLVYISPKGRLAARIVEVEGYIGENDPACHAASGPSKRNRHLYDKPGTAYLYLIYGSYYCLNFVTEKESFPAAVLLRAAEPVEGVEIMRRRTETVLPGSKLLSGPGRCCRSFGLTLEQNGYDMALEDSILYLEDRHDPKPEVEVSPRIGITKAADRLWRFYDRDSNAVSGPASFRRSGSARADR